MKKDRLLVIILGLVLANLALHTSTVISALTQHWNLFWLWMMFVADLVAISGVIWLLKEIKRGKRILSDDKDTDEPS